MACAFLRVARSLLNSSFRKVNSAAPDCVALKSKGKNEELTKGRNREQGVRQSRERKREREKRERLRETQKKGVMKREKSEERKKSLSVKNPIEFFFASQSQSKHVNRERKRSIFSQNPNA